MEFLAEIYSRLQCFCKLDREWRTLHLGCDMLRLWQPTKDTKAAKTQGFWFLKSNWVKTATPTTYKLLPKAALVLPVWNSVCSVFLAPRSPELLRPCGSYSPFCVVHGLTRRWELSDETQFLITVETVGLFRWFFIFRHFQGFSQGSFTSETYTVNNMDIENDRADDCPIKNGIFQYPCLITSGYIFFFENKPGWSSGTPFGGWPGELVGEETQLTAAPGGEKSWLKKPTWWVWNKQWQTVVVWSIVYFPSEIWDDARIGTNLFQLNTASTEQGQVT